MRFNSRHLAARYFISRAASGSLLFVLCACGSAMTLTVRPSQPVPVESVLAPKLSEHAWKRVLLLPPETPIETKDVPAGAAHDKQEAYYTAKVEKLLLSKGFEVISPEIVARADSETKGKGEKLSGAEKALILGQKTKADAVLILQSISVLGGKKYFQVTENQTAEIEPGRVKHEEGEDHPQRVDDEKCLHELPYYELRVEGKLIDSASGTVLWVGSGRQTTIDSFKDSYIADVNDDCDIEHASFIYADYLADEGTLDRTLAALLDRMLTPLAKGALAGKAVVDEVAVKAAPPPPPPPAAAPPPPPPPAPKMAVVSARGTLREGPSKKDAKIKDVPRKAKVEVVETMGEWIKVKIQDGSVGWMHESTLIVND